MLSILLFSFSLDCYHKMVSPLNGDTRGELPLLATPLIKNYVTAIPAKALAIRVFIGQGSSCEVLDA